MGTKHNLPLAERFWPKVRKTNTCWLWTASHAAPEAGGHGQFSVNLRMVKAHRVSWMLTYGSIPQGRNVLHRCNTAICVRPDHLYLGTQRDNTLDSIEAGTYHRWAGQDHPMAKLTDDDVRAIRLRLAAGDSYRRIARDYGVSSGMVAHIKHGRSWKHLP